jgi:hypothetical protein
VIASPRAESWGVAGVVRPGFCVSFILSKNRGKINHAEPGDFSRSHRSLGLRRLRFYRSIFRDSADGDAEQ